MATEADKFAPQYADGAGPVDGPLRRVVPITKSDSAVFDFWTRALNVSADGVLKVDMEKQGTNVTITVTKGTNWYRVNRVYLTGSDAITVAACD